MTILYLDASAWVKRYYREVGSERIHQMLSAGNLLACSVLGFIEVIATLARKHKAKEISSVEFEEKLRQLKEDWSSFLKLELTMNGLDEAEAAAIQTSLRGADAIHFAALQFLRARALGSNLNVVFVASDRELIAVARAAGCTVVDPTEQAVN